MAGRALVILVPVLASYYYIHVYIQYLCCGSQLLPVIASCFAHAVAVLCGAEEA